jgi:hypothetical protein
MQARYIMAQLVSGVMGVHGGLEESSQSRKGHVLG